LLNEPLQPGFSDPHGFGQRLRDLVIDESIRELGRQQWTSLGQPQDAENPSHGIPHLVLVHDFEASRIPWEVIPIGEEYPVLVSGITRRYMAQNLSIAKWLETRRADASLDVLLVVNPTGDLAAAEEEGERLRERLSKLPLVNLRFIEREQATKARLLAEFESGRYDVLHYAGHASFNPYERQRSGLVAAGGEIISGEDLASLANLPALVFFNACRSGMMRDGQPVAEVDRSLVLKARIADSPQAHMSFAEAFLRGGVANFVGTLWPVEDRGASEFARVFYEELLIGNQIGQALLKARQAIWSPERKDWANYVFYGSPSFRVKLREST
jgi:CHAT domain-containing protein